MFDSSRRDLLHLMAGIVATSGERSSADHGPSRPSTPDHVVTTTRSLESTFDDLAPGEVVWIDAANAPYRTTRWLDVDVDDVTVAGPGVSSLIKPAEGSSVGGVRVGHNARCENVTVSGIGFHGNRREQDPGAKRLHGIVVRNAANVTLEGNYVTRNHPREHGSGGSGISAERESVNVRITNNWITDFGDRGVQVAGRRALIAGNVITGGLDRAVSCDLWPSSRRNDTARSVAVLGNVLGNAAQGSLVGVASPKPQSSPERGFDARVLVAGNIGFGHHKSLCHVRGPGSVRHVTVSNNVSAQRADGLRTRRTTRFAGVTIDVASASDIAITNNTLSGYSGNGVEVNGDIVGLNVSNNRIDDCAGAGVLIRSAADATVAHNSIDRADGAGVLLDDATFTHATGNHVRSAGGAGIVTRGGSTAGHEIAGNFVRRDDRREDETAPGIRIGTSSTAVRNNTIRSGAGPAITEADSVGSNLFAGNRADGSSPWDIASPTSVARDNLPPLDVHRGVRAPDGETTVHVEFDRRYARRPKIAFGRTGGGVQDVSYTVDDRGAFDGARIVVTDPGSAVDVFVEGVP